MIWIFLEHFAQSIVINICKIYQQCRSYQHHSQVHRDDGLKEEWLKVVGHVRDHYEKDGWDVHCQDCPKQSPES